MWTVFLNAISKKISFECGWFERSSASTILSCASALRRSLNYANRALVATYNHVLRPKIRLRLRRHGFLRRLVCSRCNAPHTRNKHTNCCVTIAGGSITKQITPLWQAVSSFSSPWSSSKVRSICFSVCCNACTEQAYSTGSSLRILTITCATTRSISS